MYKTKTNQIQWKHGNLIDIEEAQRMAGLPKTLEVVKKDVFIAKTKFIL